MTNRRRDRAGRHPPRCTLRSRARARDGAAMIVLVTWIACRDAPASAVPATRPPAGAEHPRRRRGVSGERPMDLVSIGPDAHGEPRSYYVHVPDADEDPLPAVFL